MLKTCSLRKIVWISLVCPWCGEWCPDCTQHQRSYQDKLSSWRPLPRTGPVIQSKLLQCKTKEERNLEFFFTFLKVSICIVSFMDSQFYVVWILLHQLLRQFFAPQVRHLLLVLIKLNFIKLPTSSNDTPVSSARSIPILIMLEDRSIATTFTPYS